eukprot:COSAG02_NODE_5238_length_4513_cov_5.055279_2_plen_106_part_00
MHFILSHTLHVLWCFCSSQGLGFVVWGTVLDKKALKRLVASIASLIATGLPLVSALAEPKGQDNGSMEHVPCALTPFEISMVQTAFQQRNASCSYNMTINAVLGV